MRISLTFPYNKLLRYISITFFILVVLIVLPKIVGVYAAPCDYNYYCSGPYPGSTCQFDAESSQQQQNNHKGCYGVNWGTVGCVDINNQYHQVATDTYDFPSTYPGQCYSWAINQNADYAYCNQMSHTWQGQDHSNDSGVNWNNPCYQFGGSQTYRWWTCGNGQNQCPGGGGGQPPPDGTLLQFITPPPSSTNFYIHNVTDPNYTHFSGASPQSGTSASWSIFTYHGNTQYSVNVDAITQYPNVSYNVTYTNMNETGFSGVGIGVTVPVDSRGAGGGTAKIVWSYAAGTPIPTNTNTPTPNPTNVPVCATPTLQSPANGSCFNAAPTIQASRSGLSNLLQFVVDDNNPPAPQYLFTSAWLLGNPDNSIYTGGTAPSTTYTWSAAASQSNPNVCTPSQWTSPARTYTIDRSAPTCQNAQLNTVNDPAHPGNYFVTISRNAVNDVSCGGAPDASSPAWAQLASSSSVDGGGGFTNLVSGWATNYNSWNSSPNLSTNYPSSPVSFPPSTTIWGHWRMRDTFNNQSAWCSMASITTPSAADPAPIGSHDDPISCSSTHGFACDASHGYQDSLTVKIYKDGPPQSGTLLGQVTAGDFHSAAGTYCGNNNYHGFTYNFNPLDIGGTHTIYAYALGVGPTGGQNGINALLSYTPKSINCPTPPPATPTTVPVPPTPSGSCSPYDPVNNRYTVTWNWASTQVATDYFLNSRNFGNGTVYVNQWLGVGNSYPNPMQYQHFVTPTNPSDQIVARYQWKDAQGNISPWSGLAAVTCQGAPTPTTPPQGAWIKLKGLSMRATASVGFRIPAIASTWDADDPGSGVFDDELRTPGQYSAGVIGGVLPFISGGSVSYSQWKETNPAFWNHPLTQQNYWSYVQARKTYQQLPLGGITAITTPGIYHTTSSQILTTVPSGVNFVLISDSDVTINGDSKNGNNFNGDATNVTDSIAIFARNISFAPNVPNANGIFIAGGLDGSGTINTGVSTTHLKIRGNIITPNTLAMGRSQPPTNTAPSVFIVGYPQAYLDLIPYLSTTLYDWQQLQ